VKSRPKSYLFGGVSLVLLLLLAVGTAAFSKKKPIPSEKIVKVERGPIALLVVARGRIEPLRKVEVKSKANGIIQALLVDVGDPVTEGQILAELDKEDLLAQVRGAKASLDGEQANLQTAIAAEARARIEAANPELEFARRDYQRAQGLFKEKVASQQQLDDASRAYEVSRNKQQLLEAAVQTAAWMVRQHLNFAHSLIVLKEARGVRYGSFVSPGQTLVMTADAVEISANRSDFKIKGTVGTATAIQARLELAHVNLAGTDPAMEKIDQLAIAAQRERWQTLFGGAAATRPALAG